MVTRLQALFVCAPRYALTITAGDWLESNQLTPVRCRSDYAQLKSYFDVLSLNNLYPSYSTKLQSPCVMVLAFNIASADVIMLGIANQHNQAPILPVGSLLLTF
jgi:hypothetical protein